MPTKTLLAAALMGLLVLPPTSAFADGKAAAGKFTRLLEVARESGVLARLKGEGPYTVFAPTDAAFDKLAPDVRAKLLQPAYRDELTELVKQHIVPGKVLAIDIRNSTDGKLVRNALGEEVRISSSNGISIGDARVVEADIAASNGVIHVVDRVLEAGG